MSEVSFGIQLAVTQALCVLDVGKYVVMAMNPQFDFYVYYDKVKLHNTTVHMIFYG
jgi:hypothetical protein